MKLRYFLCSLAVMTMLPINGSASPTIYPTGVTLYDPEKSFNGYTLIGPSWWNSGHSSYLVDMNGEVMKEWPQLLGHSAKMLPNGVVQGEYGKRKNAHLVILDWNNKILRQNDIPMSHDAQMEGSSVGYYFPGAQPRSDGKLLLNSQNGLAKPGNIPVDFPVQENAIYEVDAAGKVVWQWKISEHFNELGFSKEGIKALGVYDRYDRHLRVEDKNSGSTPYGQAAKASSKVTEAKKKKGVDWAHINAVSYVGENPWYTKDPVKYAAFNPDNVLFSSRHMSMIAIIDKKTGKIVWKLGPDFSSTDALRKIGPIIGPHGSHIIPKGLPGAGNLLVFDNGGFSGYGRPDQDALDGVGVMKRHYSRVLEINPVTLEVVWEYSALKAKIATDNNPNIFFSPLQGNVQRLPNGNTLICEAAYGRVFEVTPDLDTVWEYVDPKWRDLDNYNVVFRAYRVPYDWVPQAKHSKERAVVPPRLESFRLKPGENGGTAVPVLVEE